MTLADFEAELKTRNVSVYTGTLRYWIRTGRLETPKKDAGGRFDFSPEDIDALVRLVNEKKERRVVREIKRSHVVGKGQE